MAPSGALFRLCVPAHLIKKIPPVCREDVKSQQWLDDCPQKVDVYFFADDVLLLASYAFDLQHTVSSQKTVSGLRVFTFKRKAM